jgi:hypothetical protein
MLGYLLGGVFQLHMIMTDGFLSSLLSGGNSRLRLAEKMACNWDRIPFYLCLLNGN